MENEYRIERISADNLGDLVSLHNIVHNDTKDRSFFSNLFDTGAFGHAFVGYLAYDSNGQVAANYTVFPIELICEGKVISAAQSGSTMTHPDHRKKGLFMILAKQTFVLCHELGIELIYGIPNKHSQPGFEKLGWYTQGMMECATISVPRSALDKVLNRIFPQRQNTFRKRILPELALSSIPDKGLEQKYVCGTHRNKAYYEYKLKTGAVLLEFDSAFLFVHMEQHSIFLGDFYLRAGKTENSFWDELKTFAKKAGSSRIDFHYSEQFKSLFHFPSEATFQKGMNLIFYNTDESPTYRDMTITGLDYDVF